MGTDFQKDIIKTPKNVVVWAARNECLDDWVMFLLYKRIYASGHFHTLKVPPELYITRPTYRKWIKVFLEQGWAEKLSDTSYRLKSIYKISLSIKEWGLNYHTYYYFKDCTKSELRTKLRWLLIQQRHDQIRFSQSVVKSGIQYSKDRTYTKSLEKIIMANISTSAPMSVFKIGKAIYRSKTTAFREKENLRQLRMLRSRENEKIVVAENVSYYEWRYGEYSQKENCYFWRNDSFKNGLVIQCYPDTITLLPDHTPQIEVKAKTVSSFKPLNNTVPSFFHLNSLYDSMKR